MPPKKTKAQTSSSQPTLPTQRPTRSTSRDPSAEPQKQSRGGRKRRHSDASNVSEQPASTTATPSKRRKRGNASIEAQDEHERLQEVIEEEDEIVVEGYPAIGAEAGDSIEITHSKHVHFRADGLQQHQVPSSDDIQDSTAQHLTPHPRKMAVKRRVTASPLVSQVDSHSKRIRRTSVRRSLPSSMLQDGETAYVEEQQWEFAPLREVLQEVKTRKARIQTLAEQLALERHNGNVTAASEIEEQLLALQDQQTTLLTENEIDDDMLVLTRHGEATMFQKLSTEDTKFTSEELTLHSSQLRTQEEVIDTERKTLQDAVVTLSAQASAAKTELQVLMYELQGLGFGQGEVDAKVILQSIRGSFTLVRESLEHILIDFAPEQVANEDLLDLVVRYAKQSAERIHVQDQELLETHGLTADLGKQVQGLLARLADTELEKDRMRVSWEQLDMENDEQGRDMANTQEDLEVKTREVQNLKDEVIDLATNIDRLTASLQKYREEETRLTDLISKMQDEHEKTVSKMNQEREETVRELENGLDRETQLRTDAEELASNLQITIVKHETENETLRNEVGDVTAQYDQEVDAREAVEADLQEKSGEITGLEARLDLAEEQMESVNQELEQLRGFNETERTQREAAESELDSRDAEVEELNKQLHEHGMKANELRQKLFEVQQLNEHKIQDLEQAASERDVQYQDDIAAEVDRREAADALALERATQIEALEGRIVTVEQEMRVLLIARDERIKALEQDLMLRAGEVELLRSDLLVAERTLAESTEERAELEGGIALLKVTIFEREGQIATMRQEATNQESRHESEVDDRNVRIAELNHNVAILETEVADLTRDKDGLERRVEQEAEQMLEYQNEKQDEIEALEATIRERQEQILNVEGKAREADRSWEAVLEARDETISVQREEIVAMSSEREEKTKTIATLTYDMEVARRKFREYVHKTNGKMRGLSEIAATYQAQVEQDGAELADDGELLLQEVEEMATIKQSTVTTQTATTTTTASSKKTRGRKKRVVDSGIGMDGEDESLLPA